MFDESSTNGNEKFVDKNVSSLQQELEGYENQLISLRAQLNLVQNEAKVKDDHIRQLEDEIGRAHKCNQQLNAKLGSLSQTISTSSRNDDKDVRVGFSSCVVSDSFLV
ncbi:hypothetical protein AB6A40_004291 [Gnathostoma spinigerum]|uniref:Uncharacterized protein n=1 Tax=Gnathostoma spinigerum TaxID=75299 RepID=A0ABD6ELI9_9BILA